MPRSIWVLLLTVVALLLIVLYLGRAKRRASAQQAAQPATRPPAAAPQPATTTASPAAAPAVAPVNATAANTAPIETTPVPPADDSRAAAATATPPSSAEPATVDTAATQPTQADNPSDHHEVLKEIQSFDHREPVTTPNGAAPVADDATTDGTTPATSETDPTPSVVGTQRTTARVRPASTPDEPAQAKPEQDEPAQVEAEQDERPADPVLPQQRTQSPDSTPSSTPSVPTASATTTEAHPADTTTSPAPSGPLGTAETRTTGPAAGVALHDAHLPAETPTKVETANPEPPTQREPAPSAKVTAGADDFQRINGIGPKVAGALHAAGIHTFAQLAQTDVTALRDALRQAGLRLAPTLPTWPEQARTLGE